MKAQLYLPNNYFWVSAIGYGHTELNAFDHALLNAGVGDLNLLRVSSILPAKSKKINPITLEGGSLTPIAYVWQASTTPGEVLSAAVATGKDKNFNINTPGLIMELTASHLSKHEIEKVITEMTVAGLKDRNRVLDSIEVMSITEKNPGQEKYMVVFAGVVLIFVE